MSEQDGQQTNESQVDNGAPRSIEEARAIEESGGSPTSLTWPPAQNEDVEKFQGDEHRGDERIEGHTPEEIDQDALAQAFSVGTAVVAESVDGSCGPRDGRPHEYVRKHPGWECVHCEHFETDPTKLNEKSCG